jgi:hypothetical protein
LKDPADSALLNGVWEVVSGAILSPGMIGLQVIKSLPTDLISASDVAVTIQSQSPRVSATTTLKIGNVKVAVSITTDLTVKSPVRLSESYISGKVGEIEIPLNSLTILQRDIYISYLDEDLMIVRDVFGTPEILRRKEYVSSSSESTPLTGDVPSA